MFLSLSCLISDSANAIIIPSEEFDSLERGNVLQKSLTAQLSGGLKGSESKILINAPTRKVWNVLDDKENLPKFIHQVKKADVVEELMGKSILAQDYNEDNSCLFNEEPLAEYFTGVSSRKYEMPKIMKAKISDGELGYDDANELVEYYNNEEAKELAMIQSERDQISLAGQNLENQKGANESQLGELNSQLEEISEKSYVPVTGFVKKKLEELEKKVMFYYPVF